MPELLQYALFLLASFAIQLVILFGTEHRFRPLRFAVPMLGGAASVVVPLLCCFTAPRGWWLLLAPLAFILCLAFASAALVGWWLAWLLYGAAERLRQKRQNPLPR